LEGFDLGARLQRGRRYARGGQVLSIAVASGSVAAQVQGSRPRPYQVRIDVKPMTKADWRKFAEVVTSQALYGAKLLAGEMPQDVETVFQSAGLSLFPARASDLKTDCSCPDWSNPCKHIAAVYYLLGEEFDRDPFLIFQLRGMGREDFLRLLGGTPPDASGVTEEALPAEPLAADPAAFWNGGAVPENLLADAAVLPGGAALPRRLGKFPFWRGRENFLDVLDRIYLGAAEQARRTLGESGPDPETK
jgi:uncharacterized Zn finger protein